MTKRHNERDQIGVLHYVTLNIRERKHAFSRDENARAALIALREHCDRHPAKLVAYVVMPEHLHFINNPRLGDCERFLSHYKSRVTNEIIQIARNNSWENVLSWLKMPEGQNQLWQEGKHSFHLYSDRLIWQKIDYIHNNPFRAGLVAMQMNIPTPVFGPGIPVLARRWYRSIEISGGKGLKGFMGRARGMEIELGFISGLPHPSKQCCSFQTVLSLQTVLSFAPFQSSVINRVVT